jgi:hydroxyacylglutathione hydrolase
VISAVPAFQDNYIWIIQDSKQQAATVVDPGDAAPVIAFLKAHRLALEAVLITHHHADHCGGLEALLLYAFENDPERSIPVYGPANEKIVGITHTVKEGDHVDLRATGLTLHVIDVPGHTAGHIAYYGLDSESTPVVFCGDTLFAGGCGRIFEGTPEQMWSSLQKLAALPDATRVYCAHEYTLSNLKFAAHALPDDQAIAQRLALVSIQRAQQQATVPSSIGIEKQSNPFLKCRDAMQFSVMRKQKDNFRG